METTIAGNVGGRTLSEDHVSGMGLLGGIGTQVTLRRRIER